MFFAPVIRRSAYVPSYRSLDRGVERFLADAFTASNSNSIVNVEQDDSAYTLRFDVPGIAKEQLSIGIEGNVVRIDSKEDAPRKYQAAYELPLDIDVATSEAKLENGVLTLKLGKKVPVSNVAQLAIN